MSAKLVCPAALILAVLSSYAVRAQAPTAAMNGPEAAVPPGVTVSEDSPAEGTAGPGVPLNAPPTPSQWIMNTRPECCGIIGGNGPIKDELYLRTGPSLPVAGPIFGHVLTTGWEVQGGARSLFFNPDRDSAWTVDLSVSSIWNGGQHADRQFPLNILVSPGNPVGNVAPPNNTPAVFSALVLGTLKELNRTAANLGVGHEWYIMGDAACCAKGHRSWRIGIDGGAGYGSESASVAINTIPGIPATPANTADTVTSPTAVHMLERRTDTFATAFVSLHTDLEIPCGCCTYLIGFRAEWVYTWSDILQLQNDSDMMDVNFLITAGVRF